MYSRRIYFVLVLVRLHLALSPSYLHPDENFQGPEVIAGMFTFYTSSEEAIRHKRESETDIYCDTATIALIVYSYTQSENYTNALRRRDLRLPSSPNMGVYEREPDQKCLPIISDLWIAYATA